MSDREKLYMIATQVFFRVMIVPSILILLAGLLAACCLPNVRPQGVGMAIVGVVMILACFFMQREAGKFIRSWSK